MAKFQFRLQNVLNIREKLERQKELEYAQALKKLEEEKAKEAALRSSKATCVEALGQLVDDSEGKSIDPREISRYNDFIEVLKDRIALQVKAVKAAQEFAEDKRKALVEAMRERKTIERLRENAYEVYIEEEKQAEQKQVDQVVSYTYARA